MRDRSTTMTVRIGEQLSEFVAENIGASGAYDNVSEYIRDLIRRDKERVEQQAFERLKAELARDFAKPESEYAPLTADMIIARHKARSR